MTYTGLCGLAETVCWACCRFPTPYSLLALVRNLDPGTLDTVLDSSQAWAARNQGCCWGNLADHTDPWVETAPGWGTGPVPGQCTLQEVPVDHVALEGRTLCPAVTSFGVGNVGNRAWMTACSVGLH